MEVMTQAGPAKILVLVLNFNGRDLLEECLPSIVLAAKRSRHACQVQVVDNASSDDSVSWLAEHYPDVRCDQRENRGLCSLNDVVRDSPCDVAILLNNDIRLAPGAIDPLVEPLLAAQRERVFTRRLHTLQESRSDSNKDRGCFITAPLCFRFDESTYEGFRTAVTFRHGLIQATALFEGHEALIGQPGRTASAGAAIAVDREIFLTLGGFDARYLPGRIEDLDLCFRGYVAGYHSLLISQSVAYHKGQVSFDREFGSAACDQLALRNTLLFQWKCLRAARHRLRHSAGSVLRAARDLVQAPFVSAENRFPFLRAWRDASLIHRRHVSDCAPDSPAARKRELEFFREFSPRALLKSGPAANESLARTESQPSAEANHRHRFPISRYYLQPAACWLARHFAATNLRAWHVTLIGLLLGLAAMFSLIALPWGHWLAAPLMLSAWFCDRIDGELARAQRRMSQRGAWLDANIDEFVDLGSHVAAAVWLARGWGNWAFVPLVLFLMGKYLFMFGLNSELELQSRRDPRQSAPGETYRRGDFLTTWARKAYHFLGDADFRIHLFVAALASGLVHIELWLMAVYFNLRWMARYSIALRRISGFSLEGRGA